LNRKVATLRLSKISPTVAFVAAHFLAVACGGADGEPPAKGGDALPDSGPATSDAAPDKGTGTTDAHMDAAEPQEGAPSESSVEASFPDAPSQDDAIRPDRAAADAPPNEAGPLDGSVCPSPVAADPLASRRASCSFPAGSIPRDTLGISAAEQQAIPIKHVIVLMKENRSYDEYFGQLPSRGQPAAEAVPSTFVNLDKSGATVRPYHETTTCVMFDPDHQWAAMHNQSNGGKMDGFVTSAANTTSSDGHFSIAYYDQPDLPFYYFLANTFAIADHFFPSVLSGTFPNRDYLLLATSDRVEATGLSYPRTTLPSIMDRVVAKNLDWAAYTDFNNPFESTLGPIWRASHGANVKKIADLKTALSSGSLPALSFIDSRENVEDEHPTADVQVGEAWTRDIYQAVVASPLWSSTALIWVFDEAGGFADHVPPPKSCVAAPSEGKFTELGIRVPMIVMSPWVRRHYVSHVVHEHTSITRFIETVFDLTALTARDANSDALLDMFDFACPPTTTAPAAPPAGTNGCR
jgi:phospholipase C